MTPEQIKAARDRCDRVPSWDLYRPFDPELSKLKLANEKTQEIYGKWISAGPALLHFPVKPSPEELEMQIANANFIFHARTDLPAALDEIDRLRSKLNQARDFLASLGRCAQLQPTQSIRDEITLVLIETSEVLSQ